MKDEIRRAAIALHDRFTHGDGGRQPPAAGDRSGGAIDPVPLDRRDFMAQLTRIAGSGAAASLLFSSIACHAQTAPQVAADDARIRTRDIEWEVRPGRIYKAYNAAPAQGGGTVPLVVVIHENRGLNDHIRDVARRLAVAGYSAVAPDFLSTAGGTPAGEEDRARTMIGQLDMAAITADGTAIINYLGSPESGSRKVGIVGFCWGGALVNRLAVAAGPALSAAVPFYGPAPDPADAARVQAPMLIVLAGLDDRVNNSARPWIAALQAAHKPVEVAEYPNVNHAFHNDSSAMRYNREAAEAAWARTLAFFRAHLH